MPDMPVALGVRTHSGWAAVVAVAAGDGGISVLHRSRMELVVPGPQAVRQPFHEAEGKPLVRARTIVGASTDLANRLAVEGLRAIRSELRGRGRVTACGLLLASGRPLPDLPAILASHALIHAAEGELFREAIRRAARACRLGLTGVPEKQVWDRVSAALGRPAQSVQKQIAGLGKTVGKPWTQDEKLATAAAVLALYEAPAAAEV